MATYYSNRPIVTDGLVLCADVDNPASFTGSTTSWTNLLVTPDPSGSLVGDPPNSISPLPKHIHFQGNPDGCRHHATDGTVSPLTVEVWCRIPNFDTNDAVILAFNNYSIWNNGNRMGYNTFSGDIYGFSSATANTLDLVDTWKQWCFIMYDDISYSNNLMYINGVNIALSQQAGSENTGNRSFGDGTFFLARKQNGSYYMNCRISMCKVYNRALSADEVKQNFNAHRGRFGI